MPDPVIVAEHLYKVFGPNPEDAIALSQQGVSKAEIFERTGSTVGVQDAGFAVEQGEIFVVMGLSGSGKSTLLRLINRLIEPTAGTVKFQDRDLMTLSKRELIRVRREQITMVFQSFALLPHLTVLENAAFGLRISGVDSQERRQRAMAALTEVGLEANAHSYPDELSGGMQQRVGLARALAIDPPVWLMDEAFSALDPLIRTQMQDQLLTLQENKPRTILFISHDLDEAMRIGDRIAIMEGGRVLQVGTAEQILEQPADDYVRSFFGGVDIANVYHAGDIAERRSASILPDRDLTNDRLLQQLERHRHSYGYVVDASERLLGVVSRESVAEALQHDQPNPEAAYLEAEPIAADASFDEVLARLVQVPYPVPVIDEGEQLMGVISKTTLLQTMRPRKDTA